MDILTIYFNSEPDSFGYTISEIVDNYIDYNVLSRMQAKAEITALLKIESEKELNSVIDKIADNRFRTESWDETWRSFLEKVYHRFKR
jgi:hypothetical protein